MIKFVPVVTWGLGKDLDFYRGDLRGGIPLDGDCKRSLAFGERKFWELLNSTLIGFLVIMLFWFWLMEFAELI